jgi:hypothetical protein
MGLKPAACTAELCRYLVLFGIDFITEFVLGSIILLMNP